VATAGDGLAHLARPVGFDDGGSGIVHAHHHRGRGALASDALDDERRGAMPLPHPADFGGADQSEQPRFAQRVQRRARERTRAVNLRGGGRNHFFGDLFKHFEIRWGHAASPCL